MLKLLSVSVGVHFSVLESEFRTDARSGGNEFSHILQVYLKYASETVSLNAGFSVLMRVVMCACLLSEGWEFVLPPALEVGKQYSSQITFLYIVCGKARA